MKIYTKNRFMKFYLSHRLALLSLILRWLFQAWSEQYLWYMNSKASMYSRALDTNKYSKSYRSDINQMKLKFNANNQKRKKDYVIMRKQSIKIKVRTWDYLSPVFLKELHDLKLNLWSLEFNRRKSSIPKKIINKSYLFGNEEYIRNKSYSFGIK